MRKMVGSFTPWNSLSGAPAVFNPNRKPFQVSEVGQDVKALGIDIS